MQNLLQRASRRLRSWLISDVSQKTKESMPERNYDVSSLKPLIQHAHEQTKIVSQWPTTIPVLARHPPTDLRRHVFQQLAQLYFTLEMNLFYLHDSLLHFQWWDTHGYSNLTNPQKMVNASSFADYVWQSQFFSLFQITESAIRRFHFALDAIAHGGSTGDYYKVRGHLFELLTLAPDTERTAFFKLTSLLRNCVHNNGVYRSPKADQKAATIVHHGKKYDFLDGFPPNCLTPEFLLEMMDETFRFFQLVTRHEKISKIELVEDWYARLGEHQTQSG